MHALRRLSLVTLLVLAVTGLLIGMDVFTASRSSSIQLAYILVSMSATGLSFATGILGLTVAMRQHHWRWFVAILLPVLIVNYAPRAFFVDDLLSNLLSVGEHTYTLVLFIITVLIPAIAPLVVFFYSRYGRPAQGGGPSLDEEELVFRSLDK